MKVLHLLSTNKFSGAENLVSQFIIESSKQNPEIKMSYCSTEGMINQKLKELKIDHISIKKNSILELNRVIKSFNPDIIHAHDIKASILASFFSKNIKIISHIHGNHTNMRNLSIKSVLYLLRSRNIKEIIWVSNSSYLSYKFKKNLIPTCTVINNVIDRNHVNYFLKKDESDYNLDLIFVGRLSPEKDPKRLIDILKIASVEKPDITLGIVGEGKLKHDVLDYVKDKDLEKNVLFLGYLNNPYKVMNDSKLMIMTSIYEGTPMCALESMELGTPVISTPTDGLVEIIDNGINGFYSNSNEEISNKIVFLLKNEKELKKMRSEALKKSIEINDISLYSKKIIEMYRRNE